MKKVAITGASGMVGSHVLRYLLAKHPNYTFVAICGWEHKGEPDNLAWAIEGNEERVEVVTHDLSKQFTPRVKRAIGKVDIILNIASESHVDRSIEEPVDFIYNNVGVALNVLEYAREVQPELYLQFSTDETYGVATDGISHKEWSPINPSNPYSASKAAQEAIAISYWRTYKIPVVITNTMNVFSPRQDWEKFIPLCAKRILNGEKIYIHAYPGAKRAGSRFYIHADSVAEALDFIIGRKPTMYPESEFLDRYNIVGDQEVDNLALALKVGEIIGKEVLYELTDAHSSRPGHDVRYALDGTKLKELGWEPTQNFEQKLEQVVRDLIAKHNAEEWI
jgi:dTDP-glucose 4,6-dehydratase